MANTMIYYDCSSTEDFPPRRITFSLAITLIEESNLSKPFACC